MKATDYLAIYGAVISTIVLAWNVAWAIRMSRSRVRIGLIPSYGSSRGRSVDGYMISVANPSSVKVTLFEMTVWFERRRIAKHRHFWNRHIRRKQTPEGWGAALLSLEGYQTPLELGPGEAREFIAPADRVKDLTDGASTIRVAVRDGLMRRHFSPEASR